MLFEMMNANKKLLIRDLTLRDGQQSLFATRMNQAQVDKVLPLYKEAGFYAMEVWGGAVPDSVMRFLNESPWDRLENIKKEIGNNSKLTALSRGRNLFGYNPYPDEVIQGFCRHSVKAGVDIMRIFDALNDVDNMKASIKFVKENGGIADCAVCFTVDPVFTKKQKFKAFIKGQKLPKKIFTIDYFVNKAKLLESLGADIITIKDMAGLIPPSLSGKLIRRLKNELNVPVDMHTHCTPGYGLASTFTAIVNGVDIVDTSIMTFAGGTAAPAYELIQIFADKIGVDTGVNKSIVAQIDKELRTIRNEMSDFDSYKILPIEFDITQDKLPSFADKWFDEAVEYAKSGKETELLDVCHKIEKFFNFPPPNVAVKNAEIPGGMYTNMLSQLKQLKLDHLLKRVLELVPLVRVDAGCPPLVTPTSQIVGVQAVNCVIDENKGDPHYTSKSTQFINLVKGSYGKTPIPINPKFRKKITGFEEEIPYDASDYKKQENPSFSEYDNLHLAADEKEELLLELFPVVANEFLKKKLETRHLQKLNEIAERKRNEFEKEKLEYDKMTDEQKQQRLIEGLYNYNWHSYNEM